MSIQLPEIVAVGIYNASIAHPKKTETPNRKTTMFELELPIGEGGISYIDEERAHITPHMIICAKPGQTRHTRLPFACYYIHMILHEGALYDILIRQPNFIVCEDPAPFLLLFQKMCEQEEGKTNEQAILLQSHLLALIASVAKLTPRTGERHRGKRGNGQVIEDAIRYIREHLTAPLTLEELAARASFSTVYFHKLFKASTGKTLHDYIEEQRIKRAIDLLLSTEMTLAEIAYECGFSSQSYFSYAFKRRMGVTPRAYVQRVMASYDE